MAGGWPCEEHALKIVTYERDGSSRVGIVEGPPGEEVVHDAGTVLHEPRLGRVVGPLPSVRLLAPVPRPGKIVGIGLNYRDHIVEAGLKMPKQPVLFAKWANAIIGPGGPIRYPTISREIDYEAELAVVIGRTTRAVPEPDALDCVLGYTCANDVSARDLQFGDPQWTRGKALDSFAPLGPWIVTSDEIPDPQVLGIRCLVNGAVLQDSSTREMIFGVAHLVSFVSQGITLDPGDVILTGTPQGVGFSRKPPVFLHPGDMVRVEIECIGALENPVAGGL